MNVNAKFWPFAALAGLLIAGNALAGPSPIVIKTVAEKQEVSNIDGRQTTRLVPAEHVVPGDTVVYTVTVENHGKLPAEKIVVTNPLAEHMTYLDDSAAAAGMDVSFSTDGGKTYAPAATVTILGKDGRPHPAVADDYTHVRFALKTALKPGAVLTASYKARLQ